MQQQPKNSLLQNLAKGFLMLMKASSRSDLISGISLELNSNAFSPFRLDYRPTKKTADLTRKRTGQEHLYLIDKLAQASDEDRLEIFFNLLKLLKPHAFAELSSSNKEELLLELHTLMYTQKRHYEIACTFQSNLGE